MTESPSGKVSSCGRLSQQRSVGRPKIPHTVSGLQMATEIGWCFGAPDFVGDHRYRDSVRLSVRLALDEILPISYC